MTIGTGVDVRIGVDTPAVYGAWTEVRRNRATDPMGATNDVAHWAASPGTLSSVSGAAFGRATAERMTNPANGAQRGGPRVGTTGLPASTLCTVRMRVRTSITRSNWSLTFRNNITSAAVVIASGITLTTGVIHEFEYTFTTPSSFLSGSGVYWINATGNTGEWIEMTDVCIEVGDTTGQGFFYGDFADSDTVRYSWVGTPNESQSIMETREVLQPAISALRHTVDDYNVVEDSTPLDPSDQTGGFGQVNITMREERDSKRWINQPLSLTDGSLGETTGTVRTTEGDGFRVQVTANSRIAQLAVERTIQPFVGTLTDGIEYLLSLCGITTGIVIDSSFNSVNALLPGGRENVYDRLKRMSAAYNFELSLVSNNIVIRPPRGRIAVAYRNAKINWTLDQSRLAQNVSGWYYDSVEGPSIAFPVKGNVDEAQVWQVDSGETQVFEVPLSASLSSVVQPTPVLSVARYDLSTSQYSVVSSEGVAIDPGQWVRSGGSVTVAIGEDTKTLIITLIGATIPTLAPFRIAMPAGKNEYYSSLRVIGDGIFWDKKQMILKLTDDADMAPDEVGADVDSEFMQTADQLYHRLLLTAARYGTDTQLINGTSGGLNRIGESGSARYPTIGTVNALYPGETIGSIFTELGPTIGDWNTELYATVRDDFENQAFGNVNGARIPYADSFYRIRTSTVRPRQITFNAERDNVVGDVYHHGETIGQWNARWADMTIRDVNITPYQGLPNDAFDGIFSYDDIFTDDF